MKFTDRFEAFSPDARRALELALETAEAEGAFEVSLRHVLIGLGRLDSAAQGPLGASGFDVTKVPIRVGRPVRAGIPTVLGSKSLSLVEWASSTAQARSHAHVSVAILVLGVLRANEAEATGALQEGGGDLEAALRNAESQIDA